MSPGVREWVLLYRTSYARGCKSAFKQLNWSMWAALHNFVIELRKKDFLKVVLVTVLILLVEKHQF